MTDSRSVLKSKNLRITPVREQVILLFMRAQRALSHSDLEKKLGEDIDRVTLYRTLNAFLESGLIHKVPDENGLQRFAYCNHDHGTHEGEHSHTHVHFNCIRCERTVCLDDIQIPEVKLPEGFEETEAVFLLKGTCNLCKTAKR
jgi:Fur family ferric uptake transcriptional regulator